LVHRFEDAEGYARKHEGPERDRRQKPEEVIAAMKIAAGMTVVDLGTGSGYFLPHLSRAVGAAGKVLALDIEPVMIRYVVGRIERERLSNVEPRLVMVDEPLLLGSSADRILIVNTYHHIPKRTAYAAKLAKALKPGGALWIVDYKLSSKNGPPVEHRIAPAKIVEELKAAGLAARVDAKLLDEQYLVQATVSQPD